MNITVRFAVREDFENIFPLFGQLWPNKSLNQNELNNVFSRGIQSDSDVLLCLELDNEIEKSKAQGMKRVELDSGFQREQAHKFYEKFGFEKRAYLFSYIL